jgi:tripartite-type tricarboxylate transporter receptor subunit TctC
VVLTATMPMIVVVNATVPAKSVKELIALAKTKPGALGFASSGSGGAPHLVGELFKGATGAPLQHIPYKGSGPAATDVAAGQVAVAFDAIAPHLAHIKSNRTRVLAAISPKRLAMFPDVPTMNEIGFPQVAASIWYGLMVQGATPKTIISKLNTIVCWYYRRSKIAWRALALMLLRRTHRKILRHLFATNWRSGGRSLRHRGQKPIDEADKYQPRY